MEMEKWDMLKLFQEKGRGDEENDEGDESKNDML
jgi:hypothetical protein